jgi:hypothetical protein
MRCDENERANWDDNDGIDDEFIARRQAHSPWIALNASGRSFVSCFDHGCEMGSDVIDTGVLGWCG